MERPRTPPAAPDPRRRRFASSSSPPPDGVARSSGAGVRGRPRRARRFAASVLFVDDDVPFAKVLSDLAHEMDYQCLVAHTRTTR